MIKVKETFDPICEASHAAHKETTTQRAKHYNPLEAALKVISGKMGVFRQIEIDRIAEVNRQAQAKAELEARAVREKELVAERAGQAALAKQREEERKALYASGERKRAQELAVETARLAAEAQRDADARAAAPLAIVQPVFLEAPKAQGVSARKSYDFQIVDELAIPRNLLTPDLVKIRKQVIALSEEFHAPGIRVFLKEQLNFKVKNERGK